MRKSIKRGIAIVAASAMALSIVNVGSVIKSNAAVENMPRRTQMSLDYDNNLVIERDQIGDTSMGKADSHTMLIYLCGSDLESYYGLANMDINEMIAADESDNVNIVIQTGGARTWRGNGISNSQIGRYVVKDNKLTLVERLPQANMGEANTFEEFLTWGVENYAAEHMSVVFWNHGGGSISGACFDERNGYDSLSLSEMEIALANVSENMTDKFDFIGFDACLMATMETANMLAPYANYMIASEETEPGYGWEYTSIVNKMVENPDVDVEELGTLIIDTYYESTAAIGQGSGATLSLVDLNKLDDVLVAFNEVSEEMTSLATTKANITKFTQAASMSENYGGNNAYEGYTNMVDLADFMKNISSYVDGTDEVVKAIEDMVVYQRVGSGLPDSNGIAFYYPLQSPSLADLNYLRNITMNPNYMEYLDKVLFASKYGNLEGFESNNWADNGYFYEEDFAYIDYEFTSVTEYDRLKNKAYFKKADFDDNWYKWFYNKPLSETQITEEPVEDEDETSVEVDEELADDVIVEGEDVSLDIDDEVAEEVVDAKVAVVVEEGDQVTVLGAIEETTFDGKWFTLANGAALAAELVSEADGVKVYTAPAMVNDKETNIRFLVEGEDVIVLGIWDGINEFGMASRGIRPIKANSKIAPLYMVINTETSETEMVEGETVVAGKEVISVDTLVEDYSFVAQVEDAFGNVTISIPVN